MAAVMSPDVLNDRILPLFAEDDRLLVRNFAERGTE
jgi:hypothetical protein